MVLVLSCSSCPTLCNPMDCSSPGSSVHGDNPGYNTGVGCHAPGDLPILGTEPRSQNYRQILYHLSHQGSPIFKLNWACVKMDLEKAEEPEIKLPISPGSSKKQESSRKTSTPALLTTLKPLTVWISKKLWKILKEMGIPDHLTCLLKNLYAGQKATARTEHGTTDWFQIGKGVRQGCILSPCLFNLYAEYIMRNAELK